MLGLSALHSMAQALSMLATFTSKEERASEYSARTIV